MNDDSQISSEQAIFEAGLAIAAGPQRDLYLTTACRNDPALRRRVESLLSADESAGSFMRMQAVGSVVVARGELTIEMGGSALAGQTLGHYQVLSLIGAGGMGEVYRAHDTRLCRDVALKIIPEHVADDPGRRAAFEREARAVAALSHPNILAIYDYGGDGGWTYAVMELLEGETLRRRLARGPLEWREAVEVGAAVAEGLAAAHDKGIVHRDLKPENLFVTADGRVKILDFGLAALEPVRGSWSTMNVTLEMDAGAVLGTVGYMSPEQVRGERADARSDIFAAGCVLYEMVTGKRAFRRDSPAETMTAILHDPVPEASAAGRSVPAELARIVRQCLAKNPNQRLQSARDLALGLRATGGGPNFHATAVARRRNRRLAAIAASVLAGAMTAAMYFVIAGNGPGQPGTTTQPFQAVEALAVLPFVNDSADLSDEYLNDAFADHLINSLSRVRSHGLEVRPLISVSGYKRERPDVVTMGRHLNVQMIVTGTLRQQGDNLSVGVALVDTRTNNQLWGNSYLRKLDGILDLQDEIARQVAAKLRLRLTAEEERRLTRRNTESPEAYRLYLKGRFFWTKRTEEGMNKGIEYFQEAIRKDPAYALAHTGLADSYVLLNIYGFTVATEAMPKARELALKALEIDEELAEAHNTLAYISHRYDWNPAAAERRYKRAIELNPNYPAAHLWYATFLWAMLRFEEALAVSLQAQELDPLSPHASASVGMSYYFAGRYDEAIEQVKQAIEIDRYFWVAHEYLGQAYLEKGMYEQALAEFVQARTLSPSSPFLIGYLGYTHAVMGNRREAETALDELKRLSRARYVPPDVLAMVYSGLGETDLAYESMLQAYEERSNVFVWLDAEPTFDRLLADPRVRELLQRTGLARTPAAR